MPLLIRSVTLIDPAATLNGQIRDLWIEDGQVRRIEAAGSLDSSGADVWEAPGLHVSPGWLDLRASTGDPGHEDREDLLSVRAAAVAGGFTGLALLPDTQPVVQSKEALFYQLTKGKEHPVRVYPVAAATLKTAGEDLTEMRDLHQAGAIAFSDGRHPLSHPDLLVKVLQYLQPFGGLLMQRPEEVQLSRYGSMHEGLASTQLGLKGMPAMAEELMVSRDLRLLAYAGGRLHFNCLSTAGAVALVRTAKREGLAVTCDVAAHQLAFTDEDLADFDTYRKVNPPFRRPEDVTALKEGLLDGTIDAIVSDHTPLDEESKMLEFDLAEFGAIGLETAFAAVRMHFPELPLLTLVEKLAINPRRILGLPPLSLHEGAPAELTVFAADGEWTFTEKDVRSLSYNSPFLGKILRGRPFGVVNGQAGWQRSY